jgi:hypothetical protein
MEIYLEGNEELDGTSGIRNYERFLEANKVQEASVQLRL